MPDSSRPDANSPATNPDSLQHTARLAPEASAGSVPVFVHLLDDQGRKIRSVPLTTEGLTVGRLPGSGLLLDAATISRNHLRVDWDGQQAQVTDLGSRAGTTLGAAQLVAQAPQYWPPSELLYLGPYILQLQVGDPVAPQPRVAPPVVPLPVAPQGPSTDLSIEIDLSPEHELLELAPGSRTIVDLTLRNTGVIPESLGVTVEGLPPTWIEYVPTVTVAPGAQAILAIVVQVPETSESQAGTFPVVLGVRSLGRDEEVGVLLAQWTILPFMAARLAITPKRARSREQAVYTLAVTNTGNVSTQYTLSADDPDIALSYSFGQEHPIAEPGQTVNVPLTVQLERRLIGGERRYTFTARVAVHNAQSQAETAQFIHTALIPIWAAAILIPLLILLLLYGFGQPRALWAGVPGSGIFLPQAAPSPIAQDDFRTRVAAQATANANLAVATVTQQALLLIAAQQTAAVAQGADAAVAQTALAQAQATSDAVNIQATSAAQGAVQTQDTLNIQQQLAAQETADAQAAAATRDAEIAAADATQQTGIAPTASEASQPTAVGTPTRTPTRTPQPVAIVATSTPEPLATTEGATATRTGTATPSPTATETPTGTRSPTATSTNTATLIPLPVISTQPQGSVIPSGTTATLNVIASGSGTLTYRWFQGTSGDTSNQVSSSTTSSGFTTEALADDTPFWVQVIGPGGFTNSSTALVKVRPVIVTVLSNSANDTYGPGDVIDIRVVFSEPVTLAGGNLTVGLNNGGTGTITPFASNTTAIGSYTVASGQTIADLDSDSLALAGGATLVDADGDSALLTIPGSASLGDTKNIAIDTTAPAAPAAPDLVAASDSGSSTTDNITNDTTPSFSGTAEANSTVTVFSSVAGNLGTTTATGGTWNFTAPVLAEGAHTITVTATDGEGNVSAVSPALAITIDTTGPAAPAAPDMTTDSGSSTTDNITNDSTPTFIGTVGANEPVTISVDGSGAGSATANGGGAWTITLSSALGDGSHNITITTTDIAGNTSAASAALPITIDTTPPATPSVPNLTDGTDGGTINNDNITDDQTPDFTGTAGANEVVSISVDGIAVGNVTADGGGAWSFTIPANMPEGTYQITATVVDVAGNVATSGPLAVTIDLTPP